MMSFSDYHDRDNRCSGDIAVPHDGQLDVADPGVGPESGLAVEQGGDALVTEATEDTAGGKKLAVTSTDLADHCLPSATMADTVSLVTKVAAVSHVSLSPLEREPLGK
jgi:hypothetical protein